MLLKDDKRTPHGLTFDVPGAKGTIKFHAWATNAVAQDAMFAPPPSVEICQEVDPVELQRTFSAMFNFAMEYVQ